MCALFRQIFPLHTACLVSLSLTITACSRSSDDGGHLFRIEEIDGVPTAITAGGPRYAEPIFNFELILTLKQDPDREESLLFRPTEFTMDRDGFFYVLDQGNGRVAVFDPGGDYVRAFGGKGKGPGEFEWMELQSLDDDIISVFDLDQQRMTRYRTDGTLLEVLTNPTGGRNYGLRRGPDDLLLLFDSSHRTENNLAYSSYSVLVIDSRRDTVAVMETSEAIVGFSQTEEVGGGGMMVSSWSIPFTGSPGAVYVPGRGLLMTSGDEPVLFLYDLTGKLIKVITIDLPLLPVTGSMRQDYEARMRESMERAAARSGRAPRALPNFRYPEFIGYWNQILVDDSGFIWLRKVPAGIQQPEEIWPYMILDPDGRYLGDVYCPARSGNIVNGRYLALVTDPDAGEVVPNVYSITPAVRGLRYP